MVATPPSSNLNHCLSDLLLVLTDRITPGLVEYKLTVVNICKMHKTGGLDLNLWCYELFDRFQ